jgi:hypothetical protein
MPEGSPRLQGILLLIGALFLLYQAWRGWRAGIVRGGINFAALVVSAVFGTFAAQAGASMAGGWDSVSGTVTGFVVGSVSIIIVFFVIWFLGAVLFKRTEHQGTVVVRFFYGFGGAVFGVLIGIVILWGGVTIIRSLGSIAKGTIEGQKAQQQAIATLPPGMPAPEPVSLPLVDGLVKLKDSLEMGPAGKVVEKVDVLPPEIYQVMADVPRLAGDPQALVRFSEYPGIQDLLNNPRIIELLNNPELAAAAERKDYLGMMRNKALLEAVEDPSVLEQAKKIDLKAAMKFALEKPTPTPAPSPHSKKKQ